MTTALVPYTELERMAASVANSKLFGVKTKDEALAIMLLSQAEGVHPMVAVQTYHIISGRPSMKADTMLARFQQQGGKVEWHTLSDTKAEATFSHPAGGSVRIDWTIERAAKAGLAKKDVWIGYARAMLRSRVISEGIRTVLPGVIQGIYSPEELQSLDPDGTAPITVEAAVETFEKPGLPADVVDEHMKAIAQATELGKLKHTYQDAYRAAKAVGDERRMSSFQVAYDARKGEIEAASTVSATATIADGVI